MKHVLAVHDISCVGKCSLTVALPVISAAGIRVSVLPTAVLSTHTGGFKGYTYRDLTADIGPIAAHWKTLGITFDAIYTGYLGSAQQLELVAELARRFKKKNTLMLIDPVMADHGRLYSGFDTNFPQGMRQLCAACADVITPNMTEATLLLGEAYKKGPYERAYVEGLLKKLAAIGKEAGKVVLSGVYFEEGQCGAAVYEGGNIYFAMAKRVPGAYHGTGDLFASVLLAALMKGLSLEKAADAAVAFTAASIARTYEAGTDVRYGVHFEAGLEALGEMGKNKCIDIN